VLVTPVQAPKANAYAERWVRTVRAECLDWLLIVGRTHLEQVLGVYVAHDNTHRPHRALALQAQRPVRDWLSSPTISRPESTDAICSAVSSTSTDELHEHLCAPHKVMEKAGMRLVRTFRQPWPDRIEGDDQGDVEYALTRAEWHQQGAQAAADP